MQHRVESGAMMDGAPLTPFSIAYRSEAAALPSQDEDYLLARIRYRGKPDLNITDTRTISVALPQLGNESTMEAWYSQAPVHAGCEQGIVYRRNAHSLFGHLILDESGFSGLRATAGEAYGRIFSLLERLGYRHIQRIWNYFPHINRHQQAQERYQYFCEGRHRALRIAGQNHGLPPAATAIGTQQPGLQVYFVAADTPGGQVENPRQVSAYRYPKRYSPRSPSFSRAIFKDWGGARHLYISGTASITGHQSRHAYRLLPQLNETLNNLRALTDNAARLHGLAIHRLTDLSLLKLYLRHRGDHRPALQRLREVVGPAVPVVTLQGEPCRGELMLEIEGFYSEG